MKIKINYSNFFLVLLFHATFISLPYWNNYDNYKYIILLIVGVFLLFKVNIFFNRKYKNVNIILTMYLFMVIISSFINRTNLYSRNVFLVSIIFAISILEVFLLFEYFFIIGKRQTLFKTLFYLILIYVAVTDIIMILFPALHIEKGMNYFVGNKFTVAYLHLQMIILYLEKCSFKKKMSLLDKLLFVLLCFVTLSVCIYTKCSTGIVGLFLLLIFYYIEKNNISLLRSTKTIFIVLFISSSILLLFSGILKIGFIRYFIENILHKDITLTGRLIIYNNINSIFSGHILLGYGLGSSFDIIMSTIHAPNTQNGILEVILEQGIISFILLMFLIYVVFRKIRKSKNCNYSLIMVYIYTVFSSIEITIGKSFLIWIALSLLCQDLNDKNINRKL
ncbi:TPA: O-antigen ligase family protein [Clostridium perfringens]